MLIRFRDIRTKAISPGPGCTDGVKPNGLFSHDFLIVVDFPQSWFQTFSSYYSRVMKGLKFFLLGDLVEYLIMINLVLNTRIII